MLDNTSGSTDIVFYLMIAAGVIGILAKAINQATLIQLKRAAENMPKSMHRLIKLIRSKYEHACMIHDRVENVDAFIDKYMNEYRGFIFKVQTWSQIQRLAINFTGFIAVAGAAAHYMSFGFDGRVVQYIFSGTAQMLGLYVVTHLSDEERKWNVIKNYMIDYFENVCIQRYKKAKSAQKEELDVIYSEPAETAREESFRFDQKLPIHIEGEPKDVKKEGQPVLKEEAIRQILEEFLA